jgi:hypothetical protein
VDLYQGSITLDAWNLTVYPDSDPVWAWKRDDYQINPYLKIFLLNKVYTPAWKNKIQNLPRDFQVAAETSFNIKSFYTVGEGYKWDRQVSSAARAAIPPNICLDNGNVK